jgi:crotonobetainyl-CoA:carnitine CoA-transferase CaiB-like acyl-CoA transferase
MLDGVVSILSHHASSFLVSGVRPSRMGNGHATIAPYDTFTASDGDFFLAVGNDEQFERLCGAMGSPDLLEQPAFATNPARVANRAELRERLSPLLAAHPRAHWIDVLTGAGVPCGAVRELPEVFADPQVVAREMVQSVAHAAAGMVKVLGVPITLSETPGAVRTAPPTLGQHTAAILEELGLDAGALQQLRQSEWSPGALPFPAPGAGRDRAARLR